MAKSAPLTNLFALPFASFLVDRQSTDRAKMSAFERCFRQTGTNRGKKDVVFES